MIKKNIGLIGFGVIGSGLYHLLNKNRDVILSRTGLDLRIKSVCDLNLEKLKKEVKDADVFDDWNKIIQDRDIDIVVELIGGLEPAGTIISEALKKGKNAVSANKKLLAEKGTDLFRTMDETGKRIGLEASIGGGIPGVLALCTGMVGNRIESITAILNGTTNYILTKMEVDSMSFEEALKDAQHKGFAEADPTFDIEGMDAGHKICLLAMLAYGKKIAYRDIPMEGIKKISKVDINYAKNMGYVIKLLGIARQCGDKIDIRVHPAMIRDDHPLASVHNEFNAIHILGDMTGEITLSGRGAGSFPTASAVLSDIVQIAVSGAMLPVSMNFSTQAELAGPDERESAYYLRIYAQDRHGILAKIASALDRESISISRVIQKDGPQKGTNYVPLVIMTHKCRESGIIKAIKEICSFDFIDSNAVFIKVEDDFTQESE